MTARTTSLLRLQESLLQTGAAEAQGAQPTLLPFEAAGAQWAVPCDEVARVQMSADVISLKGYAQLPDCVVGAVAGDNEMLSVVDAGLLLGREPGHASLKSRLIVFNEGPLKGVALLVDRVLARIPARRDQSIEGITQVDATNLNTRLQSKSTTRSEAA
jgi:chemotaxis signal transduction protein